MIVYTYFSDEHILLIKNMLYNIKADIMQHPGYSAINKSVALETIEEVRQKIDKKMNSDRVVAMLNRYIKYAEKRGIDVPNKVKNALGYVKSGGPVSI